MTNSKVAGRRARRDGRFVAMRQEARMNGEGTRVGYDPHPKSLGSLRSYSHLQMFCNAYSVTGPPVR